MASLAGGDVFGVESRGVLQQSSVPMITSCFTRGCGLVGRSQCFCEKIGMFLNAVYRWILILALRPAQSANLILTVSESSKILPIQSDSTDSSKSFSNNCFVCIGKQAGLIGLRIVICFIAQCCEERFKLRLPLVDVLF